MIFRKNSVVLALVTFYTSREETRFKIACSTISNAIAAGHAVAVVDGSPEPEIARHLKEIGAQVFPQHHPGLGSSKQQSFFHAFQICVSGGYAAILACEAEKDLSEFVPTLLAQVHENAADIVIPERTEDSWSSYPVFQKESEKAANQIFTEVTGLACDIFFGPVLFLPSSHVAGYFLAPMWSQLGFPNTYTQHLAVLQANSNTRINIQSVPIEFRYPAKQRMEEENVVNESMRKKRVEQFETLTQGYRKAAHTLKSE